MAFQWQALPAPVANSRYFISYRSTAADIAERVERDLVSRGCQVWRDKRSLPVGEEWRKEIERGLDWSQTVLLLLTEGAEDSAEVLAEVDMAIAKGRRLEPYCIGPVARMTENGASETARALYGRLSDLHIAQIAAEGDVGQLLCKIIAADDNAVHPMDPAIFRRIFSRRRFTASELATIDSSILQSYCANRTTPEADGPCLTCNFVLVLAVLGKNMDALALAKDAAMFESPMIEFYRSVLLCDGKRPGVLPPTRRDEAIAAAQSAFRATRAPLPGLHLCLLLWDANQKRGPNAAQMVMSAIRAIVESENDRAELGRYLRLFPVAKLEAPIAAAELKDVLQKVGFE